MQYKYEVVCNQIDAFEKYKQQNLYCNVAGKIANMQIILNNKLKNIMDIHSFVQ